MTTTAPTTPAVDSADGARGIGHEPALDGLRGAAVAVVMLYHFQPTWLPGGFLGVDTFMVVSGFLITRLLLGERQSSGRIALREFWGRRFRRLLPALCLVLLGVAAGGAIWLPASQLEDLRRDAWSALTYITNWRLILTDQSYTQVLGTPSPLRHLWSLAIEEQYYLVWPIVVAGCLRIRRGGRVLLGAVGLGGVIASMVAMAVLFEPGDPSRSYYGTDARAHSLLVGALLAVLWRSPALLRATGERRSGLGAAGGKVLGAAGMAALAWMVWLWVDVDARASWLYHGGFGAYAAATALLILVSTRGGPISALLSWRPLRAVGQVSYGLYLWHWPVQIFLTPVRTGFDGAALLVAKVAVTVVLAVVSYNTVEQPVRQRRWTDPMVRLLAPAGVIAVCAAFLVLALGSTPIPRYLRTDEASASGRDPEVVRPRTTARPTTTVPLPPTTAPPATTTTPPPTTTTPGDPPPPPTTTPPTTTTPPPPPPPTTEPAPPPVLPASAVLLGDSVAASIEDDLAGELSARGVLTVKSALPGCGMITGSPLDPEGQPYDFGEACADQIVTRQRENVADYEPELVVWLSSWESRSRLIDGHNAELGTAAGDREILALMRQAVDRLAAKGARVLVVTLPIPYDTTEVTHPEGVIEGVGHLNELLRRLAEDDPTRVGVVDLGRITCGTGKGCPRERDGAAVREDGLHYSQRGAAYVAPRLADALLDPDLWRASKG